MTFPMPTFTPYLPFSWCYNTGSGTSISVPSCVKANSIILFSAVRTSSQAYPSYPSGFTTIGGAGSGPTPYINYAVSYKQASGSETTLSTGANEQSMIVIVINCHSAFTYVDYPYQDNDIATSFSATVPCTTYPNSPLPPYYPAPLIVVGTFFNYPGSSAISNNVFSPSSVNMVSNGSNHSMGFKYFSKNPVDTTVSSTLPGSVLQLQSSVLLRLYR